MSELEVTDSTKRPALVTAFIFAAAIGAASPAAAQTTPRWDVTFPIKANHATQVVVLAHGTLTIDRRFPQNKVHVAIPLATIASVSEPYLQDGAWNIDLKLSKPATLHSTLDIGASDDVATTDVSLSFLTKDAAAGGKTFLRDRLGKP